MKPGRDKLTRLAISLSFAMLAGCVPPRFQPILSRKTDQYNGSLRVVIHNIQALRCTQNQSDYRTVLMGAMAWKKSPSSKAYYSIDILIRTNDWIFIEPGGSLEAIYNGTSHSFFSHSGSTGSRDVERGGRVTEVAVWDIQRSDLEEMANAPGVQFRVRGSKGFVERCLDGEARAAIKRFLDESRDFN